ncbi:uncharacterized protein [Aquarana catesbeiana]|uniref:uncharacterized protein n=1 Tax=Aquarana catesbeiana TaxID=8400 RepID=UPI003CCA5542
MPSCIVENCNSHWRKKELNVIFHVFPKDKVRIKQWLMNTGQFDESNIDEAVSRIWLSKANNSYRICSKHFSFDKYENLGGKLSLKKDAFPSIFKKLQTVIEVSEDEERKKRLCTEYNRVLTTSLSDHPSCLNTGQNEGPSLHSAGSSAQAGISSFPSSDDPMSGVAHVTESSNVPENSQSPSFLSFFRSMKRHRSSKGVMTDFPRETKDKKIGTFPFHGTKNKKIQHSPVTADVGIQCNLKSKEWVLSQTKVIASSPKKENVEELISDGMTPSSTCRSQQEESSFAIQIDDHDISYYPSNESSLESENSISGTPRVDKVHTHFGNQTAPSAMSGSDYGKERKFLVFESCLDNLLTMVRCNSNNCNASLAQVEKKLCGSCLSVYARCRNGHRSLLWESQPKIRNAPVGDVLISSAALCSGSNFLKIESFLKLLGMVSISKTTFYEHQKKYLFPAIDYHWKLNQQNIISQLSGQVVCLSGDGQCDSSGYNAKYCTYSFMEAETQKIVGFGLQQHTPGSSSVQASEGKAFVKGLNEIKQKGLNVRIVCTDRHVTIRKIIREKYPKILHRYGVQHMTKSIGAKINAASKKKGCEELAPWIPSIKNHLWWASANCEGNPTVLREQWCSLLFHVINVHRWDGCEHYKECNHLPISETSNLTRNWLRDGSCAYKELHEIVLKKTWLGDIERMSMLCHPGHPEIFHSTALKYKPKRNHFCIDAMIARTQLSILEHNSNVGEKQSVPSNSDPSESGWYRSQYGKERGQWVLRVVYEPHRQNFVYNIYNHIFDALQLQL